MLNFEGSMYSRDVQSGVGTIIHLRPGLRQFIKEMQQLYEIVVYTYEDGMMLGEVIRNLDPMGEYFQFYFGREFMVFRPTGLYKDLKLINRKMNKIVAVDFENEFINSNNAVKLSKYEGADNDMELMKLSFFLRHLANDKVKDVRKEIAKWGGFENAVPNYVKKLQEQ